jgi:hypothetical protein
MILRSTVVHGRVGIDRAFLVLWIANEVQSWWVIEQRSHYLEMRKRGLEVGRENVGMWKVKQDRATSRGERQVRQPFDRTYTARPVSGTR